MLRPGSEKHGKHSEKYRKRENVWVGKKGQIRAPHVCKLERSGCRCTVRSVGHGCPVPSVAAAGEARLRIVAGVVSISYGRRHSQNGEDEPLLRPRRCAAQASSAAVVALSAVDALATFCSPEGSAVLFFSCMRLAWSRIDAANALASAFSSVFVASSAFFAAQ